MRTVGLLLLIATAAMAQAPVAEAPAAKPIGTVDDLMLGVIWPNSDEVFYISRGAPKTDEEWRLFQGKMLMLAESANLLMMPGRAKDQTGWMANAKRLQDAGARHLRRPKQKMPTKSPR